MSHDPPRKKSRGVRRLLLSFSCALVWLTALVVPGLYERSFPDREPDISNVAPDESLVVLYAARVPGTHIADHGWFAIREQGEWQRWEVWQRAGGPHRHVRQDLLPAHQDVGDGGRRIIALWRGEIARTFAACITRESPAYRHRHRYLIWPGPNSNTYIAAMLESCGIDQELPWSFYGAWVGWF